MKRQVNIKGPQIYIQNIEGELDIHWNEDKPWKRVLIKPKKKTLSQKDAWIKDHIESLKLNPDNREWYEHLPDQDSSFFGGLRSLGYIFGPSKMFSFMHKDKGVSAYIMTRILKVFGGSGEIKTLYEAPFLYDGEVLKVNFGVNRIDLLKNFLSLAPDKKIGLKEIGYTTSDGVAGRITTAQGFFYIPDEIKEVADRYLTIEKI